MRTWHVATFCELPKDHPFSKNVMTVVEVTMVMNCETPPHPESIEGILHIIAPGLVPLLSEVNETPHVSNLG